MIELIITDRLHKGLIIQDKSLRLIATRKLYAKEITLAKKNGIGRYYIPTLNEDESADFFKEFDRFWDQVVKSFGHDHLFWRNVVSSKMQEWERSATYLTLLLFTLLRKATKESQCVVIVCSSLEEEDVCCKWARKMGWKVQKKPYLSFPRWVRRIFQEIGNLKSFLRMFSICLYRKCFSPEYKPNTDITEPRILIVSLSYTSCFNFGRYQDHFFGSLHKIIKENGNSTTYLCGPLDSFRESSKKVRECSEVSILIPYSIITWSELILLVLKVFLTRVCLPQTNFCGCDFSKLLMWNARRFEYFFNFDSAVYYKAVKRLCKNEQFDRLIQLYEGNVFERGCIQAFRKYGSGVILGYSHAVIYPLNLKMRMTENEKVMKPEPDFIVCTGNENKRLMVHVGNRNPSNIHSGCSLRDIPVLNGAAMTHPVESNILFALDGVTGCTTVLDWLMEYSEALKDYKVKLRGHPNVPIKTLLKQCLHDMPNNFYLSDGDLKEDIINSFCVIYRQTSVGIQALMNGVPAIHLEIDAPLACDPIMALKNGRWVARTPEELSNALHEICSLNSKRKTEILSIARNCLKDYFTFPDEKNVMNFLM